MTNALRTYTIFDRPDDFPSFVVVRGFSIAPDGSIVTDKLVTVFDSVKRAREALEADGLACVGRAPDDPISLVESWL